MATESNGSMIFKLDVPIIFTDNSLGEGFTNFQGIHSTRGC